MTLLMPVVQHNAVLNLSVLTGDIFRSGSEIVLEFEMAVMEPCDHRERTKYYVVFSSTLVAYQPMAKANRGWDKPVIHAPDLPRF